MSNNMIQCEKCKQIKDVRGFWKTPIGNYPNCIECETKNMYKEVKTCIVCKEDFKPKTANQKICGKNCRDMFYSIEYKAENNINLPFFRLRFEIFKRDNFTCQYCGKNVKEDKIKIHCDHINPRKNGGINSIDNLITSCEECNLGKSDVLLEDKKL